MVSKTVKAYLQQEDIGIQPVEPYNHSGNAAERAFQNVKNHMISEVYSTEKRFLSVLWGRMIKQAQDYCATYFLPNYKPIMFLNVLPISIMFPCIGSIIHIKGGVILVVTAMGISNWECEMQLKV